MAATAATRTFAAVLGAIVPRRRASRPEALYIIRAMSKRETPMTRKLWQEIGGLLVEEFCLVNRASGCGCRWVHAMILPNRETRIAARGEAIDITNERVVLVQTKASRLGMYLMGQTLFSAELVRQRFRPASVESIALCTQDDELLRPLLERHEGCRVVVMPHPDQASSVGTV
jgi:hypothetical protein